MKSGHCSAFNRYYKSTISDEISNIISIILGVNDNICEISDKYLEYENERRRIIENEYNS